MAALVHKHTVATHGCSRKLSTQVALDKLQTLAASRAASGGVDADFKNGVITVGSEEICTPRNIDDVLESPKLTFQTQGTVVKITIVKGARQRKFDHIIARHPVNGRVSSESIGLNRRIDGGNRRRLWIFNGTTPGELLQESIWTDSVLMGLVNVVKYTPSLWFDQGYYIFFEMELVGDSKRKYLCATVFEEKILHKLEMSNTEERQVLEDYRARSRRVEAANLQRHFGTLKLTLQQDDFGTYWPPASETPDFTVLSLSIQRAYKILASHCSPHGNYIGFDCRTNKVCVFQHHFARVSMALSSDMFRQCDIEVVNVRTAPCTAGLGVLSNEEQAKIVATMGKYSKLLMAPNVAYCHAAGVRCIGHEQVSTPCIRVAVWAKGIVPLGSWLLPRELDGVLIDVVEGAPPQLQGLDQDSMDLVDNAPQGIIHTGSKISLMGVAGGDGTFSGVFERTGRLFGLSNAHVLEPVGSIVRFDKKPIGKSIELLESDQRHRYLRFFRSLPPATTALVHDPPNDIKVDCGLFQFDPNIQATTALHPQLSTSWTNLNFPAPFPTLRRTTKGRDVLHATRVYKQGAQSGLTSGRTAVGFAQLSVDPRRHDPVPFVIDKQYYVCVCQCIIIKGDSHSQFSYQGDSGSLVFIKESDASDAGFVVGLLFAGSDVSLACYIEDVERVLGGIIRF